MRSITLLPGVVFVLLLASAKANACSCIPPRPPCEAFGSAGAVFVGTVIDVSEERPSDPNNPDQVSWSQIAWNEG
jgi:hypothetical protein